MILTLFAFLPEVILLMFALTLLVRGVIQEQQAMTSVLPKTQTNSLIGMRFAVVTLFMSYLYFMGTSSRFYGSYFYGLMLVDSFALFGKFLIILLGFLWMGFRFRVCEEPLMRLGFVSFEYPVLFLLSLLGGCLLLSSAGFLSAYLSLELQMLPLYTVIAFRKTGLKSIEAAFKYFILGAVGSLLILYGIALIYGYGGTTNFRDLMEIIDFSASGFETLSWLKVGIIFLLSGLLFKLALFPFHMWAPDTYEGSASIQLPFIAIIPKITVLFFLIRLWIGPFAGALSFSLIVSWIATASIVIGAILALKQKNIHRLMAYGGMVHIGFAVLGLSVRTLHGFSSALAHMITYALSFVGLFLVLISLKKADKSIETLEDLKGLWQEKPSLALSLMVMLFSLAGLPPFAGFWTKIHIIMAAVRFEFYPQIFLALIGALISIFYYLRILKAVFFQKQHGDLFHYNSYAWPLLLGLSLFLTTAFLFQEKFFYYLGRLL
jgi:NADH-quinone oxidoreductase subunit N